MHSSAANLFPNRYCLFELIDSKLYGLQRLGPMRR